MLPCARRPSIEPARFRYQPFYCEENVHHLANEPIFGDRPREVIFISNAERSVAMWQQRAGRGRPLVWDYHVVLLAHDPFEIWDLDTLLPFPIAARDYLHHSFRAGIAAEYEPRFRVIDAPTFTAAFASDRSHMRRRDGRYQRPPPPWPPIGVPAREPNLMRFADVTTPYLGELLDLAELAARVG